MYAMRPERAILDMLQWTRDFGEARKLALAVATAYAEEFRSIDTPIPGLLPWLDALQASRVPCAVISSIDRYLFSSDFVLRIDK